MSVREQITPMREGVISGHRIRSVVEPVRLPISADEAAGGARVELLRRDGQVDAIRVTCTCGEVILLDCQYED